MMNNLKKDPISGQHFCFLSCWSELSSAVTAFLFFSLKETNRNCGLEARRLLASVV